MSNYTVIPSRTSLIQSVADDLIVREHDYSANLIVFPGKRPRHFLLKELAARAQQTIVPPTALDVDRFINYCYRELLGLSAEDFNEMDAAAVLFEMHLSNERPFGKEEFKTLDRFLPLAMRMFSEMEELRIGCIRSEDVRKVVRNLEVVELRELGTLYEGFYESIARRNASTRAMRYATVANEIASISLPFERVVFAGFHGLTKSEEIIFRGLLKHENVRFIFQRGAGLQKAMQKLGVRDASIDEDEITAEVSFHPCPDTHSQIFGMNRVLEDLLENDIAVNENTVIVLPTAESLFPVIQHTLPLFPEESANISLGYSILRTPLSSFLTSMADAIASKMNDRFHAPEYLNFVLHPYTKNITLGKRADLTRILFHAIEEIFFSGAARMFFTLSELEEDERLFRVLGERLKRIDDSLEAEALREHLRGIHDRTLRAFDHVENLGNFASKVIALLEYVSEHSTAKRHPYFRRFIDEFLERVSSIQTSLLATHAFERTDSYFAFLRHVLASAKVPFPGTPLRGVQILGPLETRSLQFERVFVLDANDDLFLPRRSIDMLLPLTVRRELGLPTYLDESEWQTYTFDVLLKGANEVHLFFMNEDGKTPSSLVEKLLWARQKRDGTADMEQYLIPVHHEVSLINSKPEPIAKTTEVIAYLRSIAHSASGLDSYLNCQLQFYYKIALGLGEREEVSGELEAKHVGTFIHEVLRVFHEPHKGKELKASDLKPAAMEAVLDAVFEATFGKYAVGATYFLKEQVRERMKDYLAVQNELIRRERIVIRNLEQMLEGKLNGYSIKGRIDRIEERTRRDGSGKSRILISDYKTGSKPVATIPFDEIEPEDRTTWKKLPSVQLPLYVMLSEQNAESIFTSSQAQYIWLADKEFTGNSEIALYADEEQRERYQLRLAEVVRNVLEEIHNADIPFNPPDDFSLACRYCAFTTICGTDWAVK